MSQINILPDLKTEREAHLYYIGVIEGLTRYAWWKDGTQMVGTCGSTLKQATSEANREFHATKEKMEGKE